MRKHLACAAALLLLALAPASDAFAAGKRASALQRADTNGDGKVDFQEFRASEEGRSARQLAAVERRLAAPNVTADQRTKLEKRHQRLQKAASLSADEKERRLKARFDRLDRNHDGVVDQAEMDAARSARRSRSSARPG
jgi:hypothetical protein